MAYVYKGAGGMKLERLIALTQEAQGALDDHALEIGANAEGLLAEHRAEGHSRIDILSGDIDRYVCLDDTRGLKAAMSIEYGRKPGGPYGAMEGLFILHQAAHIGRRR